MTPTQARQVASALLAAADVAEASGQTEVSLLAQLHAMDDAARAELDAAIKAAQSGGSFPAASLTNQMDN
jgi:hypothetical protein